MALATRVEVNGEYINLTDVAKAAMCGGGSGGGGDSPIMVVSLKGVTETDEPLMSHTAAEIGNALESGKIVFMNLELAFVATGGWLEVNGERNAEFAAILDPTVIVYVDTNGKATFKE